MIESTDACRQTKQQAEEQEGGDITALVLQQPNFFGCLEDVRAAAEIAHEAGAMLVQVFDPISLGLLKCPADLGADIAVAEGQNYPPSLDPSKVELTEKIKKMPAFDPTGKLDGYLFANPSYWNANQVEWTEKWDRIKAGS